MVRNWIVRRIRDNITTTVEHIIQVDITKTADAKSNGARIIVDIQGGANLLNGALDFTTKDFIKIWAAENEVDVNNSAHLIGTFLVKDISVTPHERTGLVECIDYTYYLLSKFYIGVINTPIGINAIVQNVVQRANQGNGDSQTPITTNIASVRSNGSAFPTAKYSSPFKTAYECIAELSQPDYTGDNLPYSFWFDELNVFYWEYPSQSVSSSFTYGSEPILEFNVSKKESQVISMIIYNTGADKNDAAYVNFYLDPTATSVKNRMKYQPMTDISRDLKKQFENDGTYTAMTNADYITAMRSKAVARCQQIIAKVGQGLWEAKLGVRGAKYTPNINYTVSAVDQGFAQTILRMKEVRHLLNKNGWSTDLRLEEDPASLDNI